MSGVLVVCKIFELDFWILFLFFQSDTGERIWICPNCKLPDDGSAMVGCDTCDDWYHW